MPENKDLPRGVQYVADNKKNPYLARFKKGDIQLHQACKTLDEAIAIRQAWEAKYGKPVSRKLDTENLIGQRFGKLVVVDKTRDKSGRVVWQCKCDCGNYSICRADVLKNGVTKSCGCSRAEYVSEANKVDIKGQRFGKLTAVKRLDKQTKKSEWIWECKCDCGNLTEATVELLRKGEKIQCEECFDKYIKGEGIARAKETISKNTIDGVKVLLYTDKPNKNNSTGYKGVMLNKKNGTYMASLTVNKKVYRMTGFKTAADAYYKGRLVLEDEHLPAREEIEKFKKKIKGKN